MNPQISIIIPVYNVEPYLKRCLDSVINQSFKEIEILIIDDGSTDGSGKICDEYAAFDKRIKVVHQKNEGLSCARNLGLKNAQGKYIMFVDSDDYVDKDFCLIPYNLAIEKNADLIMFFHGVVFDDGRVFYPNNYKKRLIEDGKKTKKEALNIIIDVTSVGVYNKLYKRRLFNDVRFPEKKLFEDAGTSYKLILASNEIYFTNHVLYYYCHRKDSLSQNISVQSEIDLILMYYDMLSGLIKEGYSISIDKVAVTLSLKYLVYFGRRGEISDKCKFIIMDCFKKKRRKSLGLKKEFLLLLYRFAPVLFDFVCIATGKRKRFLSS